MKEPPSTNGQESEGLGGSAGNSSDGDSRVENDSGKGSCGRPSEGRKRVSKERQSTIDLLSAIRSGMIKPKSLKPAERRACVELLWSEGYSVAETAKLMVYSERQISRFRRRIREDRRLAFEPGRTAEMAGDVVAYLESVIERARRAARGPDARPRDKIMAERVVRDAVLAKVQSLQSMGFVNRVPPSHEQALEPTRDVVAKQVLAAVQNQAVRQSDTHRRAKQFRDVLKAEGISIEAVWRELEEGSPPV